MSWGNHGVAIQSQQGTVFDFSLFGSKVYDPADNSITTLASLVASPYYINTLTNVAVLLSNGELLLPYAATRAAAYPTASVLYDPVSAHLGLTDGLPIYAPVGCIRGGALDAHTALIVAGGGAFLFSSDSGNWGVSYPTITNQFSASSATLLTNGAVLVTTETNMMVYDSSRDAWTQVTPPTIVGQPIRLLDGNVLMIGEERFSGNPNPVAEYVPSTDTWIGRSHLLTNRVDYALERLRDGRVLVIGGFIVSSNFTTVQPRQTCELYEPTTDTWSYTGSLQTQRNFGAVVRLASGNVIIIGGATGTNIAGMTVVKSGEIYDLHSGSWHPSASMMLPRNGHTMTRLMDGSVLVTGGYMSTNGLGIPLAELYDEKTDTWRATTSMQIARANHSATLLADGRVLVCGGNITTAPFASLPAEIYDPATCIWQNVGQPLSVRVHPIPVLLPSMQVLMVGDNGQRSPGADLYDPGFGNNWRPALQVRTMPYLQWVDALWDVQTSTQPDRGYETIPGAESPLAVDFSQPAQFLRLVMKSSF